MSAEQSLCTITSGHLGPINTASQLRRCLLFFVPHCLFIIVLSLKSVSSYFLPLCLCGLLSCLTYAHSLAFCFFFFFSLSPQHPSACIHSFLYSSPSGCAASRAGTHAFSLTSSPVLPPLHRHIHLQWLFFFFFSFPAGGHLALSSPHRPRRIRFVLPSLVAPFDSCQNITPSLGTDNSTAYLLFKYFFKFFFSQDCHLVRALAA